MGTDFCVNLSFSFLWDKCPIVQLLLCMVEACSVFLFVCLVLFNELPNHFPECGSSFHSHQQWMRDSVSLHLYQHLVLPLFFILAILISIYWDLIAVLICIFLMVVILSISSICLFAICVFSSVKYLFISFSHLWSGWFVLFYC